MDQRLIDSTLAEITRRRLACPDPHTTLLAPSEAERITGVVRTLKARHSKVQFQWQSLRKVDESLSAAQRKRQILSDMQTRFDVERDAIGAQPDRDQDRRRLSELEAAIRCIDIGVEYVGGRGLLPNCLEMALREQGFTPLPGFSECWSGQFRSLTRFDGFIAELHERRQRHIEAINTELRDHEREGLETSTTK